MLHRFWCGTVAGTYVGHGDYFYTDETDTWTSFGGAPRGESWKRLAFLRKILEEGPAEGLNPIDKTWNVNTAGRPGEYYLIYFGADTPTNWPFQLYKAGVTEGMEFKADILDTWNMTITPVAGEFLTKKKDNYFFADAQSRAITLPGKPYIALRLRRVGGAAVDTPDTVPVEP